MARKYIDHKKKQQKQKHYKPTIRKIDGNLWAKLKVLLPREKSRGTRGRPVIPYRTVINGILCRLRTGCQWKMIPAEYGSGSTCHRRFQEWEEAGIFGCGACCCDPMTASGGSVGIGRCWTV